MTQYKIKDRLNKLFILSKVTQVDIFSYYLSKFDNTFSSKTIDYLAETGYKIRNPMRNDNHPSLGFIYVSKGKLKARDFAGYFWGDCFDLVGYILKVNANSKEGFMIILKRIAYDLNIYDINLTVDEINKFKAIINVKQIKLKIYNIQPTIRDWNSLDIDYWSKNGISISTLNKFYVYPILSYSVLTESGLSLKYTYNPENPCYGYYNGIDKNNVPKWDLYFPLHKEKFAKFIKSHNTLGGLLNYNKNADILIIVKSLKDTMGIYEILNVYFSKYNVTFIIPMSESTPIEPKVLNYIINNHKKTYILYDFDRIGIINSNKIKKQYPVTQLFFTNGKYGTVDYGNKDYAEYYNKKGKRNALQLIKEVINDYENEQQSYYMD